jgi:hypothetical protein
MADLNALILKIRHPAQDILIGANVAYWLASERRGAVDYHVNSLLEAADKITELAASIRVEQAARLNAEAA